MKGFNKESKSDKEDFPGIEYTLWDKLMTPFIIVKNAIAQKREDRRYRRQRAVRGYATKDLCDMRDWFVRTVRAMLIDIENNLVTYPDELSEEEWRETLLKMAHLLDIFDIWDDTAARKELGIEEKDCSAESEKRLRDYRHSAKNEFFELFNKWFYDLTY